MRVHYTLVNMHADFDSNISTIWQRHGPNFPESNTHLHLGYNSTSQFPCQCVLGNVGPPEAMGPCSECCQIPFRTSISLARIVCSLPTAHGGQQPCSPITSLSTAVGASYICVNNTCLPVAVRQALADHFMMFLVLLACWSLLHPPVQMPAPPQQSDSCRAPCSWLQSK